MVSISRVFDVEGLWEVLYEAGRHSRSDFQQQHVASEMSESEGIDAAEKVSGSEKPLEIIDSEEELTPEDEAPLFPDPTPTSGDIKEDEDETEIIIVDNMTHIINGLLSRKEKSDGMFLNLL
jgi:hypothetical protein